METYPVDFSLRPVQDCRHVSETKQAKEGGKEPIYYTLNESTRINKRRTVQRTILHLGELTTGSALNCFGAFNWWKCGSIRSTAGESVCRGLRCQSQSIRRSWHRWRGLCLCSRLRASTPTTKIRRQMWWRLAAETIAFSKKLGSLPVYLRKSG